MKKFITDIRTLAALLMASATIAACSGSDDSIVSEPQQQAATTKTCTLTVNASKGDGTTTRALAYDGTSKELNATWTAGDKVTVFYLSEQDMGGGNTMNIPTEIGTLTAQSSGASTTLTGEITTTGITIRGMFGGSSETHDLTAGDKLYLSYSGTKGEGGKVYDAEQDGTLQTLADYFDSAGAELTVSSISGSTVNTTEGTADFENNSFIIRFTLKDKATDNAINPSSLVLDCTTTGEYPLVGTQTITIPDAAYTTNGNGVVFVQLERTNQTTGFSGNITLTATVGTDTYTYEKSGVTFTNGKYYEITVKMTKQVTITDLSMVDCAGNARNNGMWTANCYMVHTAGKYKLPLVYGNAIKNGAANTVAYSPGGTTSTNYCANFVNHAGTAINAPWITKSTDGTGVNKGMGIAVTTAELLWQDAQGLITAVGISGDYLTLTVGEDATTQEGNAVIAAKAGETIVWSWHIWVTKQTFAETDLATVTTTNDTSTGVQGTDWQIYKVTPVNLGWVGEATSTTGYCTFYQWGRKDAFIPSNPIPSTGTDDTNHTVYDINGAEVTEGITYSTDAVGIGGNIQNPTVHYRNNTSTFGPCNTMYYNMWDAQQTSTGDIATATVKTVYDPSPAGFCVPTGNLYYYIKNDSGVSFIWNDTNKGRNLTFGTTNVFFPASGKRGNSTSLLSLVGSEGNCWSASASNSYSAREFYFDSSDLYITNCTRSLGAPVRAVAE